MRRNRALLCLPVLLCLLLSGCWDYRGLNELTIVTGIAVDLDEEGEGYVLTFEIVDMTSVTDSEYNSSLLVTEGATIAEAVYDANTKLHNNMYLGNAEIVLMSQRAAEEQGMHALLDSLLRDQDIRDNLHVVIATTETAGELLTPDEEQNDEGGIRSFVLSTSLDRHTGGTSNSTHAVEIYEMYNILVLGTYDLALPIVNKAEEGQEPFKLDGMALFTGDKMTGVLPEEDMTDYLLAAVPLRGGGFRVDVDDSEGEKKSVVVANRRSRPNIKVQPGLDKLRFVIDITMVADVVEFSTGWGEIHAPQVKELERALEETLAASVKDVITRLQGEGYDVLGLEEALRNRDFTRWQEMEQDWDQWFAESEITVQFRIRVDNTGMIEQYGG